MRPLRRSPHVPAVLATLLVATAVVAAPRPALADDPDIPTRSQVRAAGEAVEAGERDVQQVRADLAAAQVVVDQTAISAARAAEEFNGARYAAQQAGAEARVARRAERTALARVERGRTSYAKAVRGSLGTNRDLEAWSSIMASSSMVPLERATKAMRWRCSAFRGAGMTSPVPSGESPRLRGRDGGQPRTGRWR